MTASAPHNKVSTWLPFLVAVLSIALGAVVTWNFKIDDRIYTLNREVVTKADLTSFKVDLTNRLTNIEKSQKELLDEIRSIKEKP